MRARAPTSSSVKPANDVTREEPERAASTLSCRSGVPPDSPVARAIAVLLRDLSAPWTVSSLARAVAASRTTLARRFVEETSEPPLRHLTTLRMRRAAELLRDSNLPLAEIAPAVGYGTEFALSRAFRRHFGVSPGRFRSAFRVSIAPPICLAA